MSNVCFSFRRDPGAHGCKPQNRWRGCLRSQLVKVGDFVRFVTPRVFRSDYTCPALFERRLLLPEPATQVVLSPAACRAFSFWVWWCARAKEQCVNLVDNCLSYAGTSSLSRVT